MKRKDALKVIVKYFAIKQGGLGDHCELFCYELQCYPRNLCGNFPISRKAIHGDHCEIFYVDFMGIISKYFAIKREDALEIIAKYFAIKRGGLGDNCELFYYELRCYPRNICRIFSNELQSNPGKSS